MNNLTQSATKNFPIIVIGAGGHAKVVIDTLKSCSCNILGFTNLNSEIKYILDVPFLGNDIYIEKLNPKNILLALGIGSVKSTLIRNQIFEKWKSKGFNFVQVIHPSAILSSEVKIGEGSQILMGVVLQVGVQVMDNCILNTRCSIDHDCIIESHTHIAPGVTLSGNVHVGEAVHIGTGASIIQGVHIGQKVTIGAGSVVVKDVLKNKIVAGVPAIEILKIK